MLWRMGLIAGVTGALCLGGCSSDETSSSTTTGSGGTTGSTGGGGASSSSSGGMGGSTSSAGGGGATAYDPCGDALFCETFDDHPDVDAIDDGQTFGPWRAAVKTPESLMDLDEAHATSGTRALHMSLTAGQSDGGRLYAEGDQPLFASLPTHVYGRMMMYIDPNGASTHWTFFGAKGDAEPSSPEAGRSATYLMSSLAGDGVNTFSFVYGLSAQDPDPYHDCWMRGDTAMPMGQWACVTFEMDSVARKLRMYLDGQTDPIVAVDDHGAGCVGDVVPDDAPWYGPALDQIYVGAWSFHPLDGPLEVWIDDLAVDTEPVACPPQ